MKIYKSTELSNGDYHGDKTHVSSSVIKNAFRGREYFEQCQASSSEPTSAMVLGTYLHTLVLEPELVSAEFAFYDGATRRGKVWDAFLSENAGKTILTRGDADMAAILMAGYKRCQAALDLFSDGAAETSFFTVIDDVNVKVRCDWLRNNGDIVDLKTTSGGVTDYEVVQTIRRYSYHLSAALYLDVVKQHTGKDGDFYFVFMSKKTGETRCFKASDQMIQMGRERYKQGLTNIKGFYDNTDVIDYSTSITEIDYPTYDDGSLEND